MKKRLMVGLMAGGLMAAMLPGVASANGPLGECPDDFQLLLFDPSSLDQGPGESPNADKVYGGSLTDANGDGWMCSQRVTGPQAPVGIGLDSVLVYVDNTRPLTDV